MCVCARDQRATNTIVYLGTCETVTLLYISDVHRAVDPIPPFNFALRRLRFIRVSSNAGTTRDGAASAGSSGSKGFIQRDCSGELATDSERD